MLRGVSKLAKMLASHELKTRKLGYKYVRELFSLKPVDMSYKDVLGVCKGLYYSLWAQDKLLLQEEAVARIVKLIVTTRSRKIRSMYIRGIFETLAYEWDNLEVWRQDKFMMLVRDFFVRCLISVKRRAVSLKTFEAAIFDQVLNGNINSAIDLKLHLCLVVEQELPKVGEIPTIVQSFFNRVVKALLVIPKGNTYGSTLIKLLFFLSKQIRKYPNLPLSRLSDELLELSTNNTVRRKILRRVARILHSKRSALIDTQKRSVETPAPSVTTEHSPVVTPHTIPTRKRKLEEDSVDQAPSVPKPKRRRKAMCNGVCGKDTPSSSPNQKSESRQMESNVLDPLESPVKTVHWQHQSQLKSPHS